MYSICLFWKSKSDVEIDWSDCPATIEAGETESKVKYETQN